MKCSHLACTFETTKRKDMDAHNLKFHYDLCVKFKCDTEGHAHTNYEAKAKCMRRRGIKKPAATLKKMEEEKDEEERKKCPAKRPKLKSLGGQKYLL